MTDIIPPTTTTSQTRYINILNIKYNNLLPINYEGSGYWTCLCDCGNIKKYKSTQIRKGIVKGCGCLIGKCRREEHRRKVSPKYPKSNLVLSKVYKDEYTSFVAMRNRVSRNTPHHFKYYKSRGITVSDRWTGTHGFINFLMDMGKRPPNYSIDRIDNDGNYEPSNCRWATKKEQQNNTRNNKKNKTDFYEFMFSL